MPFIDYPCANVSSVYLCVIMSAFFCNDCAIWSGNKLSVFCKCYLRTVHERCSAFMSLGLMMMDPHVIYVCTPFLLLMRHRLSSRV